MDRGGVLNLWAVYTGDKYAPEYLARLVASVRRNLRQPSTVHVITDRPESRPGRAYQADPQLEGWWQKLSLFALTSGQAPSERNLYVDLDSVIVDQLDGLVNRYAGSRLAMAKNWAKSGYGGWQSSVMLWAGGAFPELRADLNRHAVARLWGDQEWITERLGDQVDEIEPGLVVSYKYHCREIGRPPPSSRIVTFHGKPDPHECDEPWITEHWRE